MASNYLVNVPKLIGRENYSEWTFAAENFLVLEGMSHCIKPVAGKPLAAGDDEKTKAKLIMTIDSKLYVHIKDVTTSQDLWNKLKSLFDDSGFTRRISLLRTLTSIRLENSDSMASYVTNMIQTGQKLNGTGFNISDEWIGCLLLAGLPEKFMPMIMAIEHSGMKISTDAIKTKLLDMAETDVSECHEVSAFASSQKWQHRNKNKSMVDGENGGSSVKSNVRCYRCKQIGHYRNQCLNYNENHSKDKEDVRKQTNAFSAVFLNGSFNKYDWYIDSGASTHLTCNKSWIVNPCYDQKDEIIVANNNKLQVVCSGDVNMITKTDKYEYEVPVKNVLCVPDLTTNLLSVSQLLKNGNKVKFTENGCSIYNKNDELVAVANVVNGVYKLKVVHERSFIASAVSGSMWHRRLDHVNSNGNVNIQGMKIKESNEKKKKKKITTRRDVVMENEKCCEISMLVEEKQSTTEEQNVLEESDITLTDNTSVNTTNTDEMYMPSDSDSGASDSDSSQTTPNKRPIREKKPVERYGFTNTHRSERKVDDLTLEELLKEGSVIK